MSKLPIDSGEWYDNVWSNGTQKVFLNERGMLQEFAAALEAKMNDELTRLKSSREIVLEAASEMEAGQFFVYRVKPGDSPI